MTHKVIAAPHRGGLHKLRYINNNLSAQHSTLNTQHSTLNTQHSTLNTQHSTLNTQHSTLILSSATEGGNMPPKGRVPFYIVCSCRDSDSYGRFNPPTLASVYGAFPNITPPISYTQKIEIFFTTDAICRCRCATLCARHKENPEEYT